MKEDCPVLIIEDDRKIVDLVEIHLQDLGCRLDKAADGSVGLQMALKNEYDLIILDLMLPSIDGIEICKQLRASEIITPVLMLTAKSEEIDKVLGLEVGADDYLTKPFGVREFIARVKAILRRVDLEKDKNREVDDNKVLEAGNICMDFERHRVQVEGREVQLTAKEFDLLELFIRHPGRVYNREILLDLIWGYQYNGYEHTVNSHINRLRNKIEKDPTNPQYIKTLWGVGYRFQIPQEEQA